MFQIKASGRRWRLHSTLLSICSLPIYSSMSSSSVRTGVRQQDRSGNPYSPMIDIHTMVPALAMNFITTPMTPWKIRPETNTLTEWHNNSCMCTRSQLQRYLLFTCACTVSVSSMTVAQYHAGVLDSIIGGEIQFHRTLATRESSTVKTATSTNRAHLSGFEWGWR